MQRSGRPGIQLTIERKGESNAVTLDTDGAMGHKSAIEIEEKRLRRLVDQMMRLGTPRENPGELGEQRGGAVQREQNATILHLQSVGEQLFSQLLPEQARSILRKAAATNLYLRMDEPLISVPWELCHDGVDFLATRFHMGRYVYVSREVPTAPWAPVEPGLLKILLIADPTESLPQAVREAEQLCQLLDKVDNVANSLEFVG